MMGISCLGLFTLYVDVLTVIVEVSQLPWCLLKCHFGFIPSIQVHHVKAMCAKKAIKSVRSSRVNSPMTPGSPELPTPTWHKDVVDSIIGEKGGVDGCSNESEVVNPVAHLKLLLVCLQYLWLIVIALISLFAVDHCFPHFTHSQLMHNTYTCCHTQPSHSILHFTNLICLGSFHRCLTSNSNLHQYVFTSCCVHSICHGHQPPSECCTACGANLIPCLHSYDSQQHATAQES